MYVRVLTPMIAWAWICLLVGQASGQDQRPLVITGELTKKDAFDKERKESHHKVHELELKAGVIYVIDLRSLDFDTLLRLEDAAGAKISENNDVGIKDLNSRLGFVPKKTAKYRAVVTTFKAGGLGRYELQVGTLKKVGEPIVIEGKLTEKSQQRTGRYFDVHKKQFKAGEFWQFDLMSKDFDSVLNVIFNKKLIAFDDDGGEGLNSRLILGIGETGEHLLQPYALGPGTKGAYTLRLQRLERTHPLEPTREQRWFHETASLNQAAMDLRYAGNHAEAVNALEKALELRVKLYPVGLYPKGHVDLAVSWNNLGQLYLERGEHAKARPMLERGRDMLRDTVGEKNPLFGVAINNLGDLARLEGDLAEAEQLFTQSLEIIRKAVGEAHPLVARGLNNIGRVRSEMGAYGQAEPVLKRALEIYNQAGGEKHPEYPGSLNNLAQVYFRQARFAEADALYKKVLEIRRKTLGEKHNDYITTIGDIGMLYQAQGQVTKAEPFLKQAVESTKAALGEKHPRFATTLNNLAVLYDEQGEYDKAELLTKQALEIQRESLGGKHPGYANALGNLAVSYFRKKQYATAEDLMRQCAEIWREVGGEKSPWYALALENLAMVVVRQKRGTEAKSLFEKAAAIRAESLGERHPDFANTLSCAGVIHLAVGDAQAAESLGQRAVRIVTEHLDATAAIQTEQDQVGFVSMKRHFLDTYLTEAAAAKTTAQDAYAVALPWKGAVTRRQQAIRAARNVLANSDKDTRALFARLDDVTRQYANLVNRPFDPKSSADLTKKQRDLYAEREKLEAQLAQRTEAFRTLRKTKAVAPADLQRTLPSDMVLVDFLVYTPWDAKKETLVAFVVTAKKIERIELGEMVPITAAIDEFRLTLKRAQPVTGEKDPAVFLRDKLWTPIAEHLGDAKTVLIAPDGALCRLPFGALPSANGKKYLIEERMIAVIPVPQMLPELLAPRPDRPANGQPSMLALGDVDFDASPGAPPNADAPSLVRAGEPMKWNRLPGTKGEIAALETAFRKAAPSGAFNALRGGEATESAFRKQAQNFAILHLATHGFFASPQLKSALQQLDKDGALALMGDKAPRFAGYPPGVLSGLVLAGANKPAIDGDDGVLTALEVAELDLSKVELAVLSACETGLGETAGGEGVLGLQRAFQIAGARTVVTTLWSIPDEPTRVLMERFYSNRLAKKMPALEALREAQLWMLRDGRSDADVQRGIQRLEKSAEPMASGRLPPYYWAAFVLSGDWR